MTEVWIIAHDATGGNALAGAARALGDRVVAVSLGAGVLPGADLSLTVEVSPELPVEAYASSVADLMSARGAQLIVTDATTTGRLLAGQVAARLGGGPAHRPSVVSGDSLQVTRLVYGGVAVATDEVVSPVCVLVVAPGALASGQSAGAGQSEAVSLTPTSGLRLVETRAKGGTSVDLAGAKRVVGVGRGFAAEADLELARTLAAKLEAEVACSRPIAEGVNWMPAERYLGVSGATIKPELYLAIGISGQVQHLVGVNHSKVIVAINSDKNAPIFAHADFGVVGDLYHVLPELIKSL